MSSTQTDSNPETGAHAVTEPAAHTASMPAAHKLERQEFLLLAIMVIAAFVLILNETLLGVALPDIMSDLNISASTAQWTSTGFMLTMAVVTPASGFIISRYSIRTVFVGAMALFSLGTLVAATAPRHRPAAGRTPAPGRRYRCDDSAAHDHHDAPGRSQ